MCNYLPELYNGCRFKGANLCSAQKFFCTKNKSLCFTKTTTGE